MLRQFGSKLRYLRIKRDMSQTVLAQHLGLARPAYISNLEAGRREPSLGLVVQIAELLQVSTEYLLRDTYPIEAPAFQVGSTFNPDQSATHQFGVKLHHLRTSSHMTQLELAHQLTLSSHVHISTMEHGRKAPSIDLVLKIADLFGVTTDYLLCDSLPLKPTIGEHGPAEDNIC